MQFQWNSRKAKSNLHKHGVAFKDAVAIFESPYLERLDDRGDYGEERFVVYGQARNEVIALVYTWRGRVRRVISARKATKGERETYYQAIYSA